MNAENLASRYERMEAVRQPFLNRARENATVTIPELYPPEGSQGQDRYLPWQSLGAYGVNNLASKWMLALFPPHRPFFRFQPEAEVEEEISPEDQELLDSALAKAENRVYAEFNRMALRPVGYRSIRHLVVGGNFLIWVRKGKAVGYPLDQYVASRSFNGDLIEIIVRESVVIDELAESVREVIEPAPLFTGQMEASVPTSDGLDSETESWVYTRFYKDKRTWRSYQEINGVRVPGSDASYGSKKRPPVLALRWFGQDGEDYGRAFVDDYYGDLSAVEDLSKNLIKFAGIASKVIFTQDPSGFTDAGEIREAESGDIVTGDGDEFKTVNLRDKVFDFQAAAQRLADIEARVKLAFLLNTSIQRQAERVTAEEIRSLMNELETAHAGTLSNFSDEYQLPLVELIQADMTRRRRLPELKEVTVSIITGVDAMSRNQELADLNEAVGNALQLVGPEELWSKYNPDEIVRRIFLAKGIKLKGLERTEDEAAQLRQQQQAQPLLERAAGPAAAAALRPNEQGQPQQ